MTQLWLVITLGCIAMGGASSLLGVSHDNDDKISYPQHQCHRFISRTAQYPRT